MQTTTVTATPDPETLITRVQVRRALDGIDLRELRLAAGLTQEEVARRVGCTQQAISYYERAGRLPRGETVTSLAALLLVETKEAA